LGEEFKSFAVSLNFENFKRRRIVTE
jgi:hypothetical protein